MLGAHARQRILEVGWKLRGVPYDRGHHDDSWKDLDARPTALDCSKFVCRVACEALGYDVGKLAANAEWLLDELAHVEGANPTPGDVVGYYRDAERGEASTYGKVWHLMIFLGRNTVIARDTVLGACDLADRVLERPIVYEKHWGARRWRRIDAPIVPPDPYRHMELRPAEDTTFTS